MFLVVLFVILGAMTLVAVLYGLIAAWRDRRALVVMHMVALVLVIVAWSMGHLDLIGRISLFLAMLLEAIAWLGIRHDAPAQSVVPQRRASAAVPMFTAEPIYETDVPATAEPIYDDLHSGPEVVGSIDGFGTDASGDVRATGEAAEAVAAEPFSRLKTDGHEPDDDRQAESISAAPPAMTEAPPEAPNLRHPANAGVVICVRTFALLSRPYNVTLSVLLASMKRAGLRQARLVEPTDESSPSFVEIDGLKVGLVVEDAPVGSRQIESALSQTSLDAESAEAIRGHSAHIAVDVAYDRQADRAEAVLAAMRAQAALMEFAPVIAVIWPEASNIIPAVDAPAYIQAAAADAGAATAICVSERRFELDGKNAGLLLLDSIGLGAFGLPDVQIVVPEREASRGVEALRALTRHFLLTGCDLPNGGQHEMDDGSMWRVTYTRSAFDPDREVVQIRPDADGAGS